MAKASRPGLDGQLGVEDAELAGQARAGQGVSEDAGALDVVAELVLALAGLLGLAILGFALLDVIGVVGSAERGGGARLYFEVAVLRLVYVGRSVSWSRGESRGGGWGVGVVLGGGVAGHRSRSLGYHGSSWRLCRYDGGVRIRVGL